MSKDRRLDKVEGSLTARQAVILWLSEIQPCQNVYDYIQFLRSQPESTAPITRLTGQIDHAVREAMKGTQKEFIEAAVRRAVRDVVFLIKLHHQANFKVMTDQRSWSLLVAFLAEMLNGILTEHLWQDALKRQPQQGSVPHKIKRKRNVERLQHWKEIGETFLTEVYGFQGAVTFVSTHYFDGHELLFADADQILADIIGTTDQLVGMFNDSCYEQRQRHLDIDLEEIRKRSDLEVAKQTAYLVDMAKAEALDILGEREAGIDRSHPRRQHETGDGYKQTAMRQAARSGGQRHRRSPMGASRSGYEAV